jgi:cysteine sulfinate desulfinase/cysteine desulfurase-like protein
LSAAATHAALFFDQMGLEVARLRDRLEAGIVHATPFFRDSFRLPNVAVLAFPKVHQEMLHFALMQKFLATSIGGTSLPRLHRHLISCGVDEQTALSELLPLTEDLLPC